MRLVILIALVVLVGASCGDDPPVPVEKRPLAAPNPTSYVFAMPLGNLRQEFLTKLDDHNYMQPFHDSFSGSGYFFAEETIEDALFAPDVFNEPGNASAILLHSYGAPINSPHPVYYAGGQPLEYFCDFVIHFEAIDENRTKVTIVPRGSRVANGSNCCGPHGNVAIFQDVEPTTIEEYRILQLFGRIAGTTNMPPIQLP